MTTTPRLAQARLAATLREADSIDSVSVKGTDITFAITSAGESMRLVAHTAKRGAVATLTVVRTHETVMDTEIGPITWLAQELATTTAIVRLTVDEDGAVLVRTSDDHRYMIMPGRGSGGANEAAASRWAAAWSGIDDES
ncbi:MAG TPA: hypothetical protein VM052_01110 [Candidatus Limnocylindrales bacterium]|nr:hypothetical protein [Candidatus Limnocylindrales bacterium]